MLPQPKTTYRGENDSGETEVRKALTIERDALKVWKEEGDDGSEITMLEVPVSSTSQDRDGDAFSEDGLSDLKQQLDSGTVGMWLDHGLSPETMFPDYRVLEQIGGWKEGIIEESDDGTKSLRAKGALRPGSEEAAELEELIEEGVAPVGFSVGFIVESENETEEIPGKEFESTDLLEISAVGIPSNPDAMVSDSAQAAAKAVADSGAYDGEPEKLARAITSEVRSLPYHNDHETSKCGTMNGGVSIKQSDSELENSLAIINAYLDIDDTEESDPITDVLDWAEGVDDAETSDLETVSEEALESADADDLSDLTAGSVAGWIEEQLESDEDEEGDEEDEDEEDGGKSGDPSDLRTEVRSAVKDELPEALLSEEALRETISEEVRDALADEEFEVEVTESFVEELRSEFFKTPSGSGSNEGKPEPSGVISTVSTEETDSGEGDEGGKESGSGNAPKPSPSIK